MLNKTSKLYKGLSVLFVTLAFQAVHGQLILNNGITPAEAVENILVGAGVEVSNIRYNGNAAAANQQQVNVREFEAGNTNFPLQSGVLLTTNGTGNLNDADVNQISGGSATNGAIIEFDFVATGDTLSFNYMFASSEYTGYTCSQYNDVFAFYLSGPGLNGPFSNNGENIALVPETNVPVAINTVNSGTPSGFLPNPAQCDAADPNWQANSVYFTTDFNPIFTSSNLTTAAFNGSTIVLPATASLECGETYTIRMAIANDFDTALDSGVFLEANSFKTGTAGVFLPSDIGSPAGDSVIVANCSEVDIFFTRSGVGIEDSLILNYTVDGTAIQGQDYPQISPGDSIVFLPNEDTVQVTIAPTNGGPQGDPLSLIITVNTLNECGDTISSEATVWILDEPFSTVTSTDTTILCANDAVPIWASTSGGFEPYTYLWENGDTLDNTVVPVLEEGENEFIVTSIDACGFEYTDTAVVLLNQILAIDTMLQFPADCGIPNGAVSGQGSGFTGTPEYEWIGPGAESTNAINASVWEDLPSGWYYFSIEDDVCRVEDSIFLEQAPPPTASFEANPPEGEAPLDVTFVNTSDDAETYIWDFGNGQGNTVNDQSNQNTTYTEPGVYTVTLEITEGECTDIATQDIIVTLVIPIEFDMPNVFTPNGDGVNDVFTLNPVNVVELEMTITNRWGNKVFETTDIEGTWNGRNQNTGEECTEGVYFYTFKLRGQNNEIVENHGFVHLVRD